MSQAVVSVKYHAVILCTPITSKMAYSCLMSNCEAVRTLKCEHVSFAQMITAEHAPDF